MGRSFKTGSRDRTPRSSDALLRGNGHRAERSEGAATVAGFVSVDPPGWGHLPAEVEAAFDWYAFVCAWCAEETCIGRDPREQTISEFAMMCDLLYGHPPTCTRCQKNLS